MTAIIMHRFDPAKNMRRFYRLDVQPDLFGQCSFIREWGRMVVPELQRQRRDDFESIRE
jgi:predicted DNA-binding WGR domain protein